MQAGKLRHQIAIQTSTETQDTTGAMVETWKDLAVEWAAIEPLRGRELYTAQQINALLSHRVRLRYLAGVTPKMRLLLGARVFLIQSVVNVEERTRELELECTEVV